MRGLAVQTRSIVQRRRVRGCTRRAARRVELPRRNARDDAAHDRPDARDFLVTLAVPELVAAHAPFVARPGRAPALARVAVRSADATRPTAARRALRVAVDVIPRLAAAEPRVVGLPPPRGERAGRTRVALVVDRAAE